VNVYCRLRKNVSDTRRNGFSFYCYAVAISVFLVMFDLAGRTSIKNVWEVFRHAWQLFLTGKGHWRVPTLTFLTNPEVGSLYSSISQGTVPELPPEPQLARVGSKGLPVV
jgi:hypothetical protein